MTMAKTTSTKGEIAGRAMAAAIICFLHLMHQKNTASHVLTALINGLKKAKPKFKQGE